MKKLHNFFLLFTTMQASSPCKNSPDDVNKLIDELPKMVPMDTMEIRKWEGFWFRPGTIKSAITFRSSFHARDDDVFLTSTMKTGTTWLKALSLCIIHNRQPSTDILTTGNPHFHVPTIEAGTSYSATPPPFDPYDASLPRLLHTHLPYSVLPDSVKDSKCKIVYIARNPKDTIISMWHFGTSLMPNQEPIPLEKMVDCFCSGTHMYGSFFDHVVEYWEESKKRPEKVLFIKYEELKSDPRKHVSRIAEFLGRPFGDEGEAEQVVHRCSLERLKNLDVNKNGSVFLNAPNSIFFRKGEVGDWKNYFTPQMELQVNQTCRSKLEPFGLFL